MRRRTVSELNVEPTSDLVAAVVRIDTLMIGLNPRDRIGVERVFRERGRMTVYDFIFFFRRTDFTKRLFVAADHGGIIHHFAQSEKEIAVYLPRRLLSADGCAARLERRCRHTGRQLHTDIQRIHAAIDNA